MLVAGVLVTACGSPAPVAILSGSGVARETFRSAQQMSYEADYTVTNDSAVPCAFLYGVTTIPGVSGGQGETAAPGETVRGMWGVGLQAGDYFLDLQARVDDFGGGADQDCHWTFTLRPAPSKDYPLAPRIAPVAGEENCAMFPEGRVHCLQPSPGAR
jgi:hypothetical protein